MTQDKIIEHTGGCVCGSVRFHTRGLPERITVCHCLWCQRRTGTAFGTELVFLHGNITFTGAPTNTHRHNSDESGRWIEMHFCGKCGTNMGFTLEVRSGIRTVPAGAFDNPGWIQDADVNIRHVYTRSRRHWGDLSRAERTHEAYFD